MKSHALNPLLLASNLNRKRIIINSKEQIDSEEIHEDSGSSTKTQEISKRKKRMTRVQRELKDWSTVLLADAKTREETKERRHREATAETKAAVETYKKMMTKLIDKL